jgi:hypothetical protein
MRRLDPFVDFVFFFNWPPLRFYILSGRAQFENGSVSGEKVRSMEKNTIAIKKNTNPARAKFLSIESRSSLSLEEKIAPINGSFFLNPITAKQTPEIMADINP